MHTHFQGKIPSAWKMQKTVYTKFPSPTPQKSQLIHL